jgi:hypothetical protein
MTCAPLNVPSDRPFLSALEGPAGSRWRAYYLVLKGQAFRVVVLQPGFRSVGIRENLEVIGVADLLAGVDVDKDGQSSSPLVSAALATAFVLARSVCGTLLAPEELAGQGRCQ